MVTTLLGPLLPSLAERWSLQDWQSGSLFTAQFVGSTAGVVLSTIVLPRCSLGATLGLGYAAMAGGVLALGVGSHGTGIASIFCYGIGLGLTIPATNLLVAQSAPDRSAAALNLLNLAWGIGAVAWPFLSRRPGERPALLALGAALALAGAAFASGALGGGAAAPATSGEPEDRPSGGLHRRMLFVFGLLFFLYVGTENAVGGWAAALARRLDADPEGRWSLMPSLFWGMLLLGRALAPALLRHVADATLALAGVLLAGCATALLVGAASLTAIGVGVALAGFGLASVFPIVIALMTRSFGGAAARVAGWMFAVAGLGGASLPWLVGIASTSLGGLSAGLGVAVASSLVMAALLLEARRADRALAPQAGRPA